MALYGSQRDASYMRRNSKEIMDKIVGQEVFYYKISLPETSVDIYGDAYKRFYQDALLITCLIQHDPQSTDKTEYGTSVSRTVEFRFLRDELQNIQLFPEAGDIISWQESYYEVDNVVDNQLMVGKDADYSVQSDLQNFGRSWSVICQTHLANVNKLNIVKSR